MKQQRRKQKRMLALSCLLAEQVSPTERLLWHACPDPTRSSAARAQSLLSTRTPFVIALLSVAVGSVLAVLVFLSSTAQGSTVDVALNSAANWFLAALVAGLLVFAALYAAPRILQDM